MNLSDLDPRLYFLPPYAGCYGCLGRGFVLGVPCSCVEHDLDGGCEPGMCTDECRRRAEMREEGTWTLEAAHPEAPLVLIMETFLPWSEARAMADIFTAAGCYSAVWPTGEPR